MDAAQGRSVHLPGDRLMATLAIAAGGALLGGSLFGSPQIGWLVGSVIGSLLFPPSQPDVVNEGPRLGDLSVSSSAYGAAIPVVYGTVRLAGNMIWSSGIREIKNVSVQEIGKGGSSPTETNISYSYFASFALGLCEGPAESITRIWADGKLIYDTTGSGDDIAKAQFRFRFYPGNETQDPDSLIVTDVGAAAAPAHRGLCYVVFEDLALVDFGNRIPNITFEVTFNASALLPSLTLPSITGARALPDYKRGVFFAANQGTSAVSRFDLRTMTLVREQVLEDIPGAGGGLSLFAVLPNGFLCLRSGNANTGPILLVDPYSLKIVSTFGSQRDPDFNDTAPEGFGRPGGNCSWIQTETSVFLLYQVALGNTFGILQADNSELKYVWDSNTFDGPGAARGIGTCPGAIGEGVGFGYYITGPDYTGGPTSDPLILVRLTVASNAEYDTTAETNVGVTLDIIKSLTPGDLLPGETVLNAAVGPFYDATDSNLIMQVSGPVTGEFVVKIDADDGSVLWRSELLIPFMITDAYTHSRIENANLTFFYNQSSVTYNSLTGEVTDFQNGTWSPLADQSNANSSWDARQGIFLGVISSSGSVKYSFNRGEGNGVPLSDVVTSIAGKVGLEPTDLDVSELVSTTVEGYALPRQVVARAAMEQLAAVFFFDGVESDYLIKFTLRDGKSVVFDIPQSDLAVLDNATGEYFRESRIQEVELPKRFNLTYIDRDRDHQQQVHGAQRTLEPITFRTMESRNNISLAVPVTMTETQAKQAAEKTLISAWIERQNFAVQVPWRYLELDPTDVITITLDSGTVFRVRLVRTDLGLNFAIDVDGLSEDAAQYTSDVDADGGSGLPGQEFLSSVITRLTLLCSPLLLDQDDIGRVASRTYYFMGGIGQPGWTAANIFTSADGDIFNQIGSSVAEVTWGSIGDALGDTDLPFQKDTTNTITVYLVTNTDIGLSSASELEVLNGANAAAIITTGGVDAEIIQFETATLNVDGSYTLSNLRRGRRGTEINTGIHTIGETFVLLETVTAGRFELNLGQLNTDRFYKGVTSGGYLEEADTILKASPGNDLKPYAPVHLDIVSGSLGVDIVLEWIRRTRVGGALKDGTGGVPLSEDTEEYEIEILSGAGTVLRTDTIMTVPTYTYTAANQTTDFPAGFVDETAALISNPSFETGPLNVIGTVTGWVPAGTTLASFVITGAFGLISGAQDGVNYYDTSGITVPNPAEIYQDLDISNYGDAIDFGGNVLMRFSAYHNANAVDTDTGQITIEWYDKDMVLISTDAGTPVVPTAGTWVQFITGSLAPPSGSRTARLRIITTLVSGAFTNMSWDNVTVEVDEGTKEFLNFRVYQISAQVGRGFPSKIGTVKV